MAFMGPCPPPPAHVQCSAQESERSILSNGRPSGTSTFASLLCDLFSEHQRCVREAARDGQHGCEPHAFKTSAYIPSPGSLSGEALRISACDLSAEKQKQIDTLQAHIRSTDYPRHQSWHITHAKVIGLKPVCCAAPDEPEIGLKPVYCESPEESEGESYSRVIGLKPVCCAPEEPEQDGFVSHHTETSSHQASSNGFEQHQHSSIAQQWVSADTAVGEQAQQSPPQSGTVTKQTMLQLPDAVGKEQSCGMRPRGLNSSSSRVSSMSLTSEASVKGHWAVEFFEQYKESVPTSVQGSAPSRNSISTYDVLPRSLMARTTSQVLSSMWFELLAGSLIVANACMMAVELQYNGLKGGYATKYPTFENRAYEKWPHATTVFVVLERIFTVVFTLELLFRLAALGRRWFSGCLNWIDLVFVIIGWLDWLYSEVGVVNPMMVRMVRLVRVGRGLRLARLATLSKVLSSLHLLVRSIVACVSIFSWSVCLLLVAQCISGMMLCQLVQPFIMDEGEDLIARQQVFAYYGTFSRSMITMFEIHHSDFGPACRVLLDHVGEEYSYAFLAYRCFAGFAIITIINAVFVQQTMKVAEADQDVMLSQKRKAVDIYTKKVRAFFNIVDSDGDGSISRTELQAFEENPIYQLWMSALDIEAADLRGLFGIIDTDNDGAITADELICGATRIKGPARSIDMVHVLAHLQRLHCKVDGLFKFDRRASERNSVTIARQSSPASDGFGDRGSNASKQARVHTL